MSFWIKNKNHADSTIGPRILNIYTGNRPEKEDVCEKLGMVYIFCLHKAIGQGVIFKQGNPCEIKTAQTAIRILFGIAAFITLPFTLLGALLTQLSNTQKKVHKAALNSLKPQAALSFQLPIPVKNEEKISKPPARPLPPLPAKKKVRLPKDQKEKPAEVNNPTNPPLAVYDEAAKKQIEEIVGNLQAICYSVFDKIEELDKAITEEYKNHKKEPLEKHKTKEKQKLQIDEIEPYEKKFQEELKKLEEAILEQMKVCLRSFKETIEKYGQDKIRPSVQEAKDNLGATIQNSGLKIAREAKEHLKSLEAADQAMNALMDENIEDLFAPVQKQKPGTIQAKQPAKVQVPIENTPLGNPPTESKLPRCDNPQAVKAFIEAHPEELHSDLLFHFLKDSGQKKIRVRNIEEKEVLLYVIDQMEAKKIPIFTDAEYRESEHILSLVIQKDRTPKSEIVSRLLKYIDTLPKNEVANPLNFSAKIERLTANQDNSALKKLLKEYFEKHGYNWNLKV